MGYRSGQHGRLFIKSNDIDSTGGQVEVARIRDWSIDFQQSVLDTSALGDKDRTLFHGIRTASGSGTLLYYDEGTGKSNFRLLSEKFIKEVGVGGGGMKPDRKDYGQLASEPDMVRLHLQLDPTTTGDGNKQLLVFAYVTQLGMAVSTGEIVTCSFSFEVHGAPVEQGF